jgi:hypothetical protein
LDLGHGRGVEDHRRVHTNGLVRHAASPGEYDVEGVLPPVPQGLGIFRNTHIPSVGIFQYRYSVSRGIPVHQYSVSRDIPVHKYSVSRDIPVHKYSVGIFQYKLFSQ